LKQTREHIDHLAGLYNIQSKLNVQVQIIAITTLKTRKHVERYAGDQAREIPTQQSADKSPISHLSCNLRSSFKSRH
jgi:phosphoribosyl 1,2-cyclic phosphodiesterase